MSEIEKQFNQLLEKTDPAELDMYSPIASQEMSEELLGIVPAPADNTSSTTGMAPHDGACGELRAEGDSCQGSLPSLMNMVHTLVLQTGSVTFQYLCSADS